MAPSYFFSIDIFSEITSCFVYSKYEIWVALCFLSNDGILKNIFFSKKIGCCFVGFFSGKIIYFVSQRF